MITQLPIHTRFGFQGKWIGHGFWQRSLKTLQGMSQSQSANLVGLDIGSTQVSLVQLRSVDQTFFLERFGVQRVPVVAGGVQSLQHREEVLQAIRILIKRCESQQKYVSVSLSGASVIIKRITLPPMMVEEVEGYLTWEGTQYLPFDMNEVYWDYHLLGIPGYQEEGCAVRTVFFIGAKRKAVEDLQSIVLEAGLQPVVFDVNVLALSNMYVMTHPTLTEGLVLLVNVTENLLNMCVMNGTTVVWMRDAPVRIPQIDETLSLCQTMVKEIISEVKRTAEYLAADECSEAIKKIIFYGDIRDHDEVQQGVQEELGCITEFGNPFQGINTKTLPSSMHLGRNVAPLAAIAVGLAGRKRGDR